MKSPIELTRLSGQSISDIDTLHKHLDDIRRNNLAGIVLSDPDGTAFRKSVEHAASLGMSGNVRDSTMTFNYDTTGALPETTPDTDEWEQMGITPLHADGERGSEMLSISRCRLGNYAIYVARHGVSIEDESPLELWDTLHEDTYHLLAYGEVDTTKLSPQVACLDIAANQTAIFNPSNPHMGVTTNAPRRVNTTFFTN